MQQPIECVYTYTQLRKDTAYDSFFSFFFFLYTVQQSNIGRIYANYFEGRLVMQFAECW